MVEIKKQTHSINGKTSNFCRLEGLALLKWQYSLNWSRDSTWFLSESQLFSLQKLTSWFQNSYEIARDPEQRPRIVKTILEGKKGRITFGFKNSLQGNVIKRGTDITWHMGEWNRSENLKIHHTALMNWFSTRVPKLFNREGIVF